MNDAVGREEKSPKETGMLAGLAISMVPTKIKRKVVNEIVKIHRQGTSLAIDETFNNLAKVMRE